MAKQRRQARGVGPTGKGVKSARSNGCLIAGIVAVGIALIGCTVTYALLRRQEQPRDERRVELVVAYSPEKGAVFRELVDGFNDTRPSLSTPNKDVIVTPIEIAPDEMAAAAAANQVDAISPDSSIWLGEVDRAWDEAQGTDTGLVGDSARYMVSPVVIAMWRDVAAEMGYPERELGWQDLLRAADGNPQFRWSHPSANSASGLLATLALFYAGSGTTRGLTQEIATSEETLAYVARLEKTVKHYGEGELAVMEQVEARGREYLDAFVVQEQLVVQYNARDAGAELVAIYPSEGTLWEDHPLALLEHPDRTDEERLAFQLFKEYLATPASQALVLRYGYRPTDLSIPLDGADSPIRAENGVDPAKPYTTLQVPGASVIAVVRNAWRHTKRQANIYLVVDTSGSMKGNKIVDAQTALQTFVAQVQGGQDRVGLIGFATRAREQVPLTQVSEGREMLTQAIDRLEATGNTALIDGVDLAYDKLVSLNDRERINAIVVMTDGKENRSNTRISALTGALGRSAQSDLPIVVFCIAYGSDADLAMLNAISGAAGGFTRQGELGTIEDLYKTLSTYF